MSKHPSFGSRVWERSQSGWQAATTRLLFSVVAMLLVFNNVGAVPDLQRYSVPDNLPIPIQLDARVSARTLVPGTELRGNTVYDISIRGGGKIPKGSVGVFVCTEVVRARVLGQEARIVLDAHEVLIKGGGRLLVQGEMVVEGESLEMESLGVGAMFCCLGFLIRGGDAVIGRGIVLTVFVDGEQEVLLPIQ